jgi:hypothetical protein
LIILANRKADTDANHDTRIPGDGVRICGNNPSLQAFSRDEMTILAYRLPQYG